MALMDQARRARSALHDARGATFRWPRTGGVAGIGDSITAGATSSMDWGILAPDSWLTHVAKAGLPYCYNAGIYDQTTEQIASRLPALLDRRPDVVVILAGVNDVYHDKPVPAALELIGTMVTQVQGAGAAAVLGTITPVRNQIDATHAFNDQVRALAGRLGAGLVDFHSAVCDGSGYRPGMTTDGLHPTPAGAAAMATVAEPVLRGLLA